MTAPVLDLGEVISARLGGRLPGLVLPVPDEAVAKRLRKEIIEAVGHVRSGHLGASLSCIEILLSVQAVMGEEDRFLLGKGHAAPALYAVLSEAGHFPKSELRSLRKFGSILQGHPDMRTPGVDMVSGSLGQALSVGLGMALAAKMDGRDGKAYVLIGDGECDEGQIWEAAMTASHHKANGLVAIVDRNYSQVCGQTEHVVKMEPFADKWKAFGWNVVEADGHSLTEMAEALKKAAESREKPTVIIAHTVKGKGVSFIEENGAFHNGIPSGDELGKAIAELT